MALLGFLEDEPSWARLLFEVPWNGRRALVWERSAMGVLTALLDDGSPQAIGEIALDLQLTAELVAGGVFAVICSHVHETHGSDEAGALVELAPLLMAFVVAPYLGHGAAQEELTGTPLPQREGTIRTSDKRASTPGLLPVAWTASAHLRGPIGHPGVRFHRRAVSRGLQQEGSRVVRLVIERIKE